MLSHMTRIFLHIVGTCGLCVYRFACMAFKAYLYSYASFIACLNKTSHSFVFKKWIGIRVKKNCNKRQTFVVYLAAINLFNILSQASLSLRRHTAYLSFIQLYLPFSRRMGIFSTTRNTRPSFRITFQTSLLSRSDSQPFGPLWFFPSMNS